jgi:histidyl-tRNA synthetase
VLAEFGDGRVDVESGARITGLGLDAARIAALRPLLELTAKDDPRPRLRELLQGRADGEQALREVDELAELLTAMGVPDHVLQLQPSLARGMDYYTGPIFELHLLDAPQFGSVAGGGRYDNLVARFSGEVLSGTGASIGIDRLLAALLELGSLESKQSQSQVLVTVMDKNLVAECLAVAGELRAAGWNTEVFLKPKAPLKKQLAYADTWGIPVAVLLGGDELAAQRITVKDLRAGTAGAEQIGDRAEYLAERKGQVTIPRAELCARVSAILGGGR